MSAKYSIDDNCWMMKDNKVVEVIIRAIITCTFKESEQSLYVVRDNNDFVRRPLPGLTKADIENAIKEDKLFFTKAELLESL